MKGLGRDIRLIPVVLIATICLFVLKFSGLVFEGGYTLGDRLADRNKQGPKIADGSDIPETPSIVVAGAMPDNMAGAGKKKSWAQDMFNYPGGEDVTGSVGATKPKEEKKDEKKDEASKPAQAKKPENPPKDPGGTVVTTEPPRIASPGERAVLERLQDRRQEIERRAREMDMRESLMKQAEKRIDAKLLEVKKSEAKLKESTEAGEKTDKERFKSLVTMYENMKPKDAARIFDRLDIQILVEVTSQIAPRKMSEILGQMSPQAAEKLTVELATRATANHGPKAPELPKIEGQPTEPRPAQTSQR
jgi:flagellar motility protein MotE (MotC chaperone)